MPPDFACLPTLGVSIQMDPLGHLHLARLGPWAPEVASRVLAAENDQRKG